MARKKRDDRVAKFLGITIGLAILTVALSGGNVGKIAENAGEYIAMFIGALMLISRDRTIEKLGIAIFSSGATLLITTLV